MIEAGMPAFDPAGERVGVVEDLYLDRATGQAAFVLVGNGAAPGTGSERTIVPLIGSTERGDALMLGFGFGEIASAPSASGDEGLTPERQQAIYDHFGASPPADMTAPHEPPPLAVPPPLPPEPAPVPAPQEATTQALPEEAMTRSEEQLVVDKVDVPAERVRLVKHVVTEEVTVSVTVRREELRVERDPIVDPEAVELAPGADIGPAEMEFFLLAEQPVVSTRVVPIERVRVSKDAVMEARQVTGEVRKEQIDVEREPGV